ncbi:MAG: hypothetical protein L6R42_007220 [Xanthoria sp. 1 TBL-2021]|nr:MAG: hypothetical protein L6R42_007220 [Xanthoria sp. 1 TBL-2021]
MEVLNSAPTESQFTPLSTHQSQTPSSFYSGPPVLYHRSPSTTILINSHELESAPAFQKLVSPQQRSNGSAHPATEDEPEDLGHEITIRGVDIWVTSDKFLLFSPTLSTGVSIPYPSITLHAIQRSPVTPSLLLQLLSSAGPQFDDHDPEGTISLTIIPQNSNANGYNNEPPPPTPITPRPALSEAEMMNTHPNAVEKLFSALSACADLHPDHDSNSDFDLEDDAPHEDSGALYTQIDGLPPPMPGSGGWITAENVGEFFDEEGNYRGGEGLGEGAGRVREREDDDEGGVVGANGDRVDGHEGETEETKWRRTG